MPTASMATTIGTLKAKRRRSSKKLKSPAVKFDMGGLVLTRGRRADGAVALDFERAPGDRVGRRQNQQPGKDQRCRIGPALGNSEHHGGVEIAKFLGRAMAELKREREGNHKEQ